MSQLTNKSLLDILTRSGGSGGSLYNSAGLLVPFSEPGLDYDPVTLALKGLLVEPQVTNLCLYSNEFTNAAWSKAAAGTASAPVITGNFAVGPDGVTGSASRAQFALNGGTAVGDRSDLTLFTTTVIGQPTCAAIWIRSRSGGNLAMQFDFNGNQPDVAGFPALLTVTPTWQRFEIRRNSSISATERLTLRLRGTSGSADSADVEIFGAMQVVNARACGSYVHVAAGSAVTRTSRIVTITGTTLSNLLQQGAGTMYVAFTGADAVPAGLLSRLATLDDGGANNRLTITRTPANTGGVFNVASGVTNVDQATGIITLGALNTIAVSFKNNEVLLSVNGSAVVSDTANAISSSMTRIQLGNDIVGTNPVPNHIADFFYIPKATPAAELPSLAARIATFKSTGVW